MRALAAASFQLQETLQWLADPANLNTDLLPPGLETYDPLPFLSSTGNVFMVTLLPQVCERHMPGPFGRLQAVAGCPAALPHASRQALPQVWADTASVLAMCTRCLPPATWLLVTPLPQGGCWALLQGAWNIRKAGKGGAGT